MERAGKIIRRSIYTLLKDFDYFTTTPAILLLPFSACFLLSQSLYQSSPQTRSFFHAARISFLNLNLCQLIFSYVFSLPLALTCLVIAKASIIQSLYHHQHTLSLFGSSFRSLYKSLVLTYLCNIFLIITMNMATFLVIWLASGLFKGLLGLSSNNRIFMLAAAAVLYMIFTNTMIICNLALVVAGMDDCTGCKAIRKACLLKRATNSMALLLALPINLGLASIEALFQYRIVRAYDHLLGRPSVYMVLEGLLIAYLFSLLIVLDTIACCLFIKSCASNFGREQVEICYIQIELVREDSRISASSLGLDELP